MSDEDVKLQVKGKLESDKIKLWLAPYRISDPNSENVASNDQLQILAQKYAEDLKINEKDIFLALQDLQKHSVERAKANEHFKDTGIAALRITIPPEINGSKHLNMQVKLDILGKELITMIATETATDSVRMKLIHKGKVINHDELLKTQNVKNGAQMLLILLAGTPENIQKDNDLYTKMQSARTDAELLSEDTFGDYMQLEDQAGNSVQIPVKEKKALMVAMTLHEKGRTALKEENYPLALVFLLEADKYFSECNAVILKSVDNYALLNLDIAWCYLCLQSITHIPDAESRLTICENNFHRSYGENLERVIAIKGSDANEKALFMRLHLLQGIVYYHQNNREKAKTFLKRAENELKSLNVDDLSLTTLIEMGYTVTEARMGLRACDGDIQRSADFIINTRKKRSESRKRTRQERESKALGYCDDKKQYVSAQFVQMIVDMGFPRTTAVLALKKSNNHVSNAIQIIQDQPETLNLCDLPSSFKNNEFQVNDEVLRQLVDMGFDPTICNNILQQTFNNLDNAIELLSNDESDIFTKIFNDLPGQSTSSAEFAENIRKQKKNAKAAYKRLAEGIDTKDDDYLDLDLKREEEFLIKYKKYLE